MRAGARAAGLGLCLLNACAADVVSVGAWVDDAKPGPGPTLDGSPGPALDGSPGPILDLDAATKPPLEPAGPYIEAELGELSGGFEVREDENLSGGKYLTAVAASLDRDAPGEARARYLLDVREDGEYVLWGRMLGPDPHHNRFWFQIDGGTWYLWRLSTGEAWYWDDLHDDTSYREPVRFTLTKGVHELMLGNASDSVGLDRLYFTAAGDEPPGNDTPCRPPDSIEVAGECLPSCGSLRGTNCSETLCADATLLEAYDCSVCCRI